jgi:sugar lactone lactonase YvrE
MTGGRAATGLLERFAELAEGLQHPEGVAWDPSAGRVVAGGEGGQIYAITLEGQVEVVANTGGSILGVALDGRGLVYACDPGREQVVRADPGTGLVETYSAGVDGGPAFETPNWGAFDDAGNLYVTSSDNGLVFRIAPGGRTQVWTEGVAHYPNGCCLSEDGGTLVVVEGHAGRLVGVPILPDGGAGEPDVIADLPGTDPDGVTLDADGDLWVPLYRPDGLARVRASDRSVETVAHDPLARVFDAPTNLAFCGPDLDRAVVANVGDTFLLVADLGVRGHPLHRPEVP